MAAEAAAISFQRRWPHEAMEGIMIEARLYDEIRQELDSNLALPQPVGPTTDHPPPPQPRSNSTRATGSMANAVAMVMLLSSFISSVAASPTTTSSRSPGSAARLIRDATDPSSTVIGSSTPTAFGDAASASGVATPSTAPQLSLKAQLLIAAGTIALFVIICVVIYFVLLRFFNVDVTGRFRRLTRRGERIESWKFEPYPSKDVDAGPYVNLGPEKPLPSKRPAYTPIIIPTAPKSSTPSPQALSRADMERQTLGRDALLAAAASLNANPSASPVQKLYTTPELHGQHFYTPPEPPSQSFYRPTEPLPRQYYPPIPPEPEPVYAPNRPLSELSSLSSGFGDAKIDVPESGPTKPTANRKTAARRESRASRASRANANLTSRFSYSSWISTPSHVERKGNRDTIYSATTAATGTTTTTTSSEDSAPRFRTVNSWVDQQASRVERKQERRQKKRRKEVEMMPAMPDMPAMDAAKEAYRKRSQSEVTEPVFTYHPGEEVPIAKGKRVSSKILDAII